MKTEHLMLCEDPHSTWSTKENPGGVATPGSGASVETRKGKPVLSPITIEVHEFSQETQEYMLRHGS